MRSEIEYVDRVSRGVGIDPDSGQGLATSDGCSLFSCQKWEGDRPTAPKLVRDSGGFWCCPGCRASYGRDARG